MKQRHTTPNASGAARSQPSQDAQEFPMSTPSVPDNRARAFCAALAEETSGMSAGSWRMLDTVASRMRLGFFEAEAIAKDCARRGWTQIAADTVRLKDEGRAVVLEGRRA